MTVHPPQGMQNLSPCLPGFDSQETFPWRVNCTGLFFRNVIDVFPTGDGQELPIKTTSPGYFFSGTTMAVSPHQRGGAITPPPPGDDTHLCTYCNFRVRGRQTGEADLMGVMGGVPCYAASTFDLFVMIQHTFSILCLLLVSEIKRHYSSNSSL